MEGMSLFFDQVCEAPSLMWMLAVVLSLIASQVVSSFLDSTTVHWIGSTIVFFAITLMLQVAFINGGFMISSNKETNIVAAAGIAICIAMLLFVAATRAWYALVEQSTSGHSFER